ncbi:RNA-binding S4 domain-containing protein [Paracoccus spongiarum]|uniref:S4 domain-containing protein n=1 Tax=Paracoccus spongiarum TaxID=3064387 RepID=A0ABT9JDT0_9RHOB|nr:S4 domain-containing protein [Paracoccus sp. 2205BS29-5]MDP5307986.1 S4 domain-containing protein [Paracoccus sp. 2205BS29-5]
MSGAGDGLRLDKWLFHARLFRSRGLAAARIEAGGVRLNGQPCRKPGRAIRPGDLLVLSAQGSIRRLRVAALGARRGPFSEARTLYHDLDAAAESVADPAADRS